METKTNHEFEAAKSRITTLITEIGEQLNAITSPIDPAEPNDVGSVIAEQEKSEFICKQAELIAAFINRDNNDPRDAYIAELEEKLQKMQRESENDRNRWYKEYQTNQHLKAALKSLTTILTQD